MHLDCSDCFFVCFFVDRLTLPAAYGEKDLHVFECPQLSPLLSSLCSFLARTVQTTVAHPQQLPQQAWVFADTALGLSHLRRLPSSQVGVRELVKALVEAEGRADQGYSRRPPRLACSPNLAE